MKKKFFIILLLLYTFLLISFACKKKHKWMEVGAPTPSDVPVEFGVHLERGTDSNATPVYVAPIYYPMGRDETGKCRYDKIMYEMDELTPENIDAALRDLEIINADALFCDVLIYESDSVELIGPGGASDKAVTITDGLVRYVVDDNHVLESEMVNDKEYEEMEDKTGMITTDDVIYAITATFKENYQFVNCSLRAASYEDYKKGHKKS